MILEYVDVEREVVGENFLRQSKITTLELSFMKKLREPALKDKEHNKFVN